MPNTAAQIRRDLAMQISKVLGAPRFSPYLFCAFCAFLRLFRFSLRSLPSFAATLSLPYVSAFRLKPWAVLFSHFAPAPIRPAAGAHIRRLLPLTPEARTPTNPIKSLRKPTLPVPVLQRLFFPPNAPGVLDRQRHR